MNLKEKQFSNVIILWYPTNPIYVLLLFCPGINVFFIFYFFSKPEWLDCTCSYYEFFQLMVFVCVVLPLLQARHLETSHSGSETTQWPEESIDLIQPHVPLPKTYMYFLCAIFKAICLCLNFIEFWDLMMVCQITSNYGSIYFEDVVMYTVKIAIWKCFNTSYLSASLHS